MGVSHLSGPLFVGGGIIQPGDLLGLAMSRLYPYNERTLERRCRIAYVDSQVDTSHPEYDGGSGKSWRCAKTTIQAGINAVRYQYGSTTSLDLDDDHQSFVLVAPGNYAERVAFTAKNLHVIGLGHPGGDTGVTLQPSSPTTACFIATGTGNEIANMYIAQGSDDVPAMLLQAEASHVWGMKAMANSSGGGVTNNFMTMYDTGLKGARIHDCFAVGYKDYGIYQSGGYAIEGFIERMNLDCYSTGAGTMGIYMAAVTGYGFRVFQNFIGQGYTGSISVSSAGVLVGGNYCYAQPTAAGATIRYNYYSSAGA